MLILPCSGFTVTGKSLNLICFLKVKIILVGDSVRWSTEQWSKCLEILSSSAFPPCFCPSSPELTRKVSASFAGRGISHSLYHAPLCPAGLGVQGHSAPQLPLRDEPPRLPGRQEEEPSREQAAPSGCGTHLHKCQCSVNINDGKDDSGRGPCQALFQALRFLPTSNPWHHHHHHQQHHHLHRKL